MPYSLRRQPNGSYALLNTGLGETMHPQLGPWLEANQLYVEGTRLAELLAPVLPAPARRGASGRRGSRSGPHGRGAAGAPAARGGELVLFDVGLGGAATAMAALACREQVAQREQAAQRGPVRSLCVVSFEQDLEALRFALQHGDQLTYLHGREAAAQALLERGEWRDGTGASWLLRQGDFAALVEQEPLRADVVFFDPFSPRSNPGPWSVPALEALFRCRRPGGLMRLATYSSAFGVRAALLLAGFFVGEGPRLAGRATTLASTAFFDLARPLDPAWLARWRRDREPWPPLSDPAQRRQLREQLLAHPQWSQMEQARADLERPARRRALPGRMARSGPPARPGARVRKHGTKPAIPRG